MGTKHIAAAPRRSQAGKVKPRRLAHVLVFTTDVPKAIDFYQRILGLRLFRTIVNDVWTRFFTRTGAYPWPGSRTGVP